MARFEAHDADLAPEYELFFDDPKVGFKIVKDTLWDKYGPKGYLIRQKAREQFLAVYRKFRAEILDYIERYDMAMRCGWIMYMSDLNRITGRRHVTSS